MAISTRPGHPLTIRDLHTVFRGLYEARNKWNSIGLALGMNHGDLAAITEQYRDDPDKCFKESLSRWLKQAEPEPTWEVVVSALESPTVGYEKLAERMKGKYLCLPLHTHGNAASQPINEHQSSSDTNNEYFHCPCHRCDVLSYCDNGCPKSNSNQYPYLDLSKLDEEIKQDLVQKLSEDTTNIIKSFANLLTTTGKSLKCREVEVCELVKVALDIGAYESDKNQLPLLSEDRQKLQQAKSIDSAFIMLGEHMSFFNHEILSHIIDHLGSKEDKENLTKYCIQFKKFCERRIFEVPPSVFSPNGQKRKDQKCFVALATNDLVKTLKDVTVALRRIASLLHLRVSTLQLRRIDLASVILLISIPTSVAHYFST